MSFTTNLKVIFSDKITETEVKKYNLTIAVKEQAANNRYIIIDDVDEGYLEFDEKADRMEKKIMLRQIIL